MTRTPVQSSDRRVAVFRESFLPLSETFIRDHLLNLPSWAPTMITMRRVRDGLDAPGVPVRNAGADARLTARVKRGIARRAGLGSRLHAEISLSDALRAARAQVVHAHFGPDGALIRRPARRLGLPLVVTFHGYDATTYPEILGRTPRGARLVSDWDALMADADAIIAVSGFVREELIRRGAQAERIHVIPCGVNTSALPWSLPPDDGGLAFVGRLVEKKGAADLLHAAAALPDPVPVRILGDGPLRADLEALAERLGVEAQFLGAVDSGQVRAAIERSTLVVMPSRRASDGDCEGLPVVSLEASALGRPVVAYAHSGLVESVISGETGRLTPEGDVAGLTTHIKELLGDREERNRLSRNARRHVEAHFELSTCLQRIEDVYADIAGERESR
jgi:colanic acid/amylovoran biosynthesis glycosyltransferase